MAQWPGDLLAELEAGRRTDLDTYRRLLYDGPLALLTAREGTILRVGADSYPVGPLYVALSPDAHPEEVEPWTITLARIDRACMALGYGPDEAEPIAARMAVWDLASVLLTEHRLTRLRRRLRAGHLTGDQLLAAMNAWAASWNADHAEVRARIKAFTDEYGIGFRQLMGWGEGSR